MNFNKSPSCIYIFFSILTVINPLVDIGALRVCSFHCHQLATQYRLIFLELSLMICSVSNFCRLLRYAHVSAFSPHARRRSRHNCMCVLPAFNNITVQPPQVGDTCAHRAGNVASHVIHVTLHGTTSSMLHFTLKHVQTCLLRHIAIITLHPIVRHGYGRCTVDTINQRARNRYPTLGL